MIFKTFNSNIDKSISKIGMFNKSFWAMQQDLKHGNGLVFSIFGGQNVTNKDKQAILNLNAQLKDGVKPGKAWATTMTNCSIAAQNQARQCLKAGGSLADLVDGQKAAEASTVGLTIAQTALNVAVSLGIGLLISLAVKGISKLINYQDELIEKSKEAIKTFEEARNSLSSNKETIEEISSDYAKLAQGVDSLGRNVSLNTEEYKRYNEIVNKIADMFPQMVQGYTDEGNAIIANKGNVEELTKAYEEQKKAYQDLIITKSAETFAGYKAKVAESPSTEFLFKGVNGDYSYIEQIKALEELIEVLSQGKEAFSLFAGEMHSLATNEKKLLILESTLKKAGVEENLWGDYLNYEKLTSEVGQQAISSHISTLKSYINAETATVKPILNSFIEQSSDFKNLDSNIQDIVKQIIGQFDAEFYFQRDNVTDMVSYVTENIVSKFQGIDGKKIAKAFEDAIDLKSKLQNGEISVNKYLSAISEFKTLIDGFDDNTKKSIDLIFTVNSSGGLNIDTMINNVKSKLQDEFDDRVGELSLTELQIAVEEIELDQTEIYKEIESKLKELEKDGAVNLLLRPQIDTSELNEKGWDAGEGIATVFSSTYSNEDGTVALNFTPIIADPKTGEYLGVLTPEELQRYAEDVIAGTRTDDLNLQIGGKFEGENAINRAVYAAEKIHNLHEKLYIDDESLLSWDELKQKIQKFKDESNRASNSIQNLSEAFEKLYDAIDDVLSKQEKLADAFKKTRLGATLTIKELYELIKEMPSLAQYASKDGNGYTISTEGFEAVSKENDNAIKELIAKDIESVRNDIALLEKEKELQAEKDKLYQQWENTGGANKNLKNQYDEIAAEYEEVANQCQNITLSMEELTEAEKGFVIFNDLVSESFDEAKLAIDGVNEAYDNAKSKISEYNSNIQTIDNAIKTLKDDSLLTYDEMNALVEISPALQDSFEQQEDGYYIVIDALEKLREQSYETRNDYIEDRIASARADIEAAEQAKKSYEEAINSIKNRGAIAYSANADYIASLEENIEGLDEQIQNLYDTINKFEGLQGVIITTDTQKEDDLSDKLQNQIDYYKTILAAVDAVKNKYSEAIDKEIDALEDGKAALKDSNDERQRELDLIEARNNLENAKKRRVWVYSEGEGFKQVADEKAVKDAEEELRDVIVDIQEAEIDKQIDALQEQKEQLEENTKALTELESEIEDAKNIAQAVNALGLNDESELLTLPDDTVEEIRNGLAGDTLQKDIEDNKNNEDYVIVSMDELLQSLGAKVNAAEAAQILGGNNQSVYDAAVQGFKDALNEQANNAVSSVVNNGGTNFTNTFNIYDATDPERVAKIVNQEITDLFTKIGNSIK